MLRLTLCAGLVALLVACGGKDDPEDTIDVTGLAYGANVTIWSGDGRERSVGSNGDGTFLLAGIRTPYDVLFDYGTKKALIIGSRAAYHENARPPLPLHGPEELSTVSFGLTPAPASDAATLWVVDCDGEVLASRSGTWAQVDRGLYLDDPRACDAKVLVLNAGYGGYGGQGTASLQLLPAQETAVAVALDGVSSRLMTFQVTDPHPDTVFTASGLVWPARGPGYAAHVLNQGILSSTTIAAPQSSALGLAVIFAAASDGEELQGRVAWRALALDGDQEVRDVVLPDADIILEPTPGDSLAGGFALRPLAGSVYVFVIDGVSITTRTAQLSVAELAARGITLQSGTHTLRAYLTTAASVDDDLSLDGIIRQRDAVRVQTRQSTFVVD